MAFSETSFYRASQSSWQWFAALLRPFPKQYGPVFKKYYNFLSESQWWKSEQLTAYRDDKLRALIAHAYRNVPYYHQLFDEHKLKPTDIRTAADLAKLPVLTKDLIRQNYQDLIARGSEKEFWIESHTSGSTGQPLTFLLDPESSLREIAYRTRAWTFGSYQTGDKVIMLRSFVPKKGEPLYRFDRPNNFIYLSAYHLTPEVMRDYVEIIRRSGAKVLRGYPSSIYIFSQFLLAENVTLPQIETVITSSEMLLPQYRESIEKAFSTQVLDWYGCNERVATVSQCPVNHGYHTNIEYGVLEVVDERDRPIKAGVGRILGTNLDNYVMPLLRYQPDDIGRRQAAATCACGRGLPIEITQIEGRSDEILEFHGRKIPPINFYTLFHGIPGVAQFQLVQEGKNLLVKIVPAATYTQESERMILSGLTERVGPKVKIIMDKVKLIERDAKSGKVKAIINHSSSR